MSIVGLWFIAGLTLVEEWWNKSVELLGEESVELEFKDLASKSSVFRLLCRRVSEEKKSRGELPEHIVGKFRDLAFILREICETCRELDLALAKLTESIGKNSELESLIESLYRLTAIIKKYGLHRFKWNSISCEKNSVVFDARLLRLKLDFSGVVRVLSGGDYRIVNEIDTYWGSGIQVIKVSYRHGKKSKVTGAVFYGNKWYSLESRVLLKPGSLISVQIKPMKGSLLRIKASVDDIKVKIEGDSVSLIYSVSLFVDGKRLFYYDSESGELKVLEAFSASSVSKSEYLFIPLKENRGLLIDLSESGEGVLYYAYLKKNGRVQRIPVSEYEFISKDKEIIVKIKPRERKPVILSTKLRKP